MNIYGKKIRQQKGASLFIVLVVVLLSLLLAVWSSRSSLFNEMMVGVDADRKHAIEAAQALIEDAKLDVLGIQPNQTRCKPLFDPNFTCRPLTRAADNVYFPFDWDEYIDLQDFIASQNKSCIAGICTQNLPPQFWLNATTLATLKGQSARYGELTGAVSGGNSNPILYSTSATDARAWYWVEVLPYTTRPNLLVGNAYTYRPGNIPFVYRITAIAQGRKSANLVVLQTMLVAREAQGTV